MYQQITETLGDMAHRGMKGSTVKTYEIHLRHFFSYAKQKQLDYTELRPRHMRGYVRASLEAGNSTATVNARLSAIRTFYDILMENEEVSHNPVIRTLYIKSGQTLRTTKVKPLTPEQKQVVLAYMAEKEYYVYLGFRVLFATGLRISELTGLTREDVKYINDRVVVHVRKGKRGSDRMVPVFCLNTAQMLQDYVPNQYTDPLFKLTKRGFQYHAQKATEKLGINFTVNMARHTFATERLQEGVRLDVLQKLMGHSDISTTMLYARTMDIDVINSAKPLKGEGVHDE